MKPPDVLRKAVRFWKLTGLGALWAAGCVGTMLYLDFGPKGEVKLTADDGFTIWCVMFLWYWVALFLSLRMEDK